MFENVNFIWCGLFTSEGQWIHPDVIIDSWEMILVVSGTVHIRVGDREYTVEKDGVLLMPPGIRHAGTKTSTDVSFYWIHFTDCPLGETYLEQAESYHLILLLRQTIHFCNAPERNPLACDYLARLVLMELEAQSRKAVRNRLVHEVASWIRHHADRPIRTAEVAEQFRYNPDYLNRLFHKEYGVGLKSYIDRMRMERIKSMLLNSREPVQVVAERCGFSDYKYFLKFFKRHQNVSPSEFRNTYFYIDINHN